MFFIKSGFVLGIVFFLARVLNVLKILSLVSTSDLRFIKEMDGYGVLRNGRVSLLNLNY